MTIYSGSSSNELRIGRTLFAAAVVLALFSTALDTDAAPGSAGNANSWWTEWQDPTHPQREDTQMNLPLPIARYVAAENSGDLASLAEFFAPGATVHDEGRDYVGLEAIREWMAQTRRKYGHRLEPLGAVEGSGKSWVRMRLAGNFPGSPVTVEFLFALAGGKIESLRVNS